MWYIRALPIGIIYISKFSFITELNNIVTGQKSVTLILDDPAGNSYVQSLNDDGSLDDRLKITKYTRNFDQNEELGINDMKTENY